MDAENHPDPFREGMSHGLNRAMRISSSLAAGAQVLIHLHNAQVRAAAERDERTRRVLQAQLRAERDGARAGWAPALDPQWLRQAGLYHVAQVWGAAMPYADQTAPWHDPTATTALRRCEDRLRDLHPYAMARYDRLRGDGLGPAEAMREAAPLFARHPRPYDASSVPRSALDAGTGTGLVWVADTPARDTTGEAPEPDALKRRGREIVASLQARAAAKGRAPLGEAELHTILEAITNLPDEVIEQASETPGARSRPVGEKSRPGPARRDTQPWQRDFPTPITEVVAVTPRTTAPAGPAAASAKAVQQPAPRQRST